MVRRKYRPSTRDKKLRAQRRIKRKHKMMVGYQYHPPKKTWRQKWREILKILRE